VRKRESAERKFLALKNSIRGGRKEDHRSDEKKKDVLRGKRNTV